MNQDVLEGRLLAHRRILQLIVGELAGSAAGERIEALLRERSIASGRPGYPGAVETAGMGLELAVAEEFRRIVDGLRQSPAEPDTIRPAGPKLMQDPPEEWDEVDEAADELFPVERSAPAWLTFARAAEKAGGRLLQKHAFEERSDDGEEGP